MTENPLDKVSKQLAQMEAPDEEAESIFSRIQALHRDPEITRKVEKVFRDVVETATEAGVQLKQMLTDANTPTADRIAISRYVIDKVLGKQEGMGGSSGPQVQITISPDVISNSGFMLYHTQVIEADTDKKLPEIVMVPEERDEE